MSIFQEMVDQHGFAGAYESVKRFVRKLRGPASPDPRAVIITEPGHEAQVDYGTGPTIRDPNSGKYRRSRLFVFTLGYSRKCVRLLTFQSSTRIWAELHERAFRKLGGAVKIIVPDNLGEGVLKPDIYDPTLNPLYRDVLAHYGAVAMPCRVVIQTAKAKWKAVSVMHRRPHSKGSASKVWRKRKPTWTSGKNVGPTLAFTARRSARYRRCSLKKSLPCCHCHWNPFATTSMASARFIWTAV
jgi:transposase